MSAPLKTQRKTKNLGKNTASSQDESYTLLEAVSLTAKCTDGHHEGERVLPVRQFYLNKGGKGLQGACIQCQKNRRKNRSIKNRATFGEKTADEIRQLYTSERGSTRECSKCKESKPPAEFPISIGMECGLHNQCILCSTGNSQGNGGLRDFIFMPDKDGIKYVKKDKCERCEGTDKLAVDHILPIARGGTDCIPNKQTLCVHCNSKKSDTIDSVVTESQLCTRYRDSTLNYTDLTLLTQGLARKVADFRKKSIEDASLEQIRESVVAYIKKYNLGHNVDRIINKIASIFKKV